MQVVLRPRRGRQTEVPIEIGETLYLYHRKPWCAWLEANFDTASEIWLVYPNKASGKPRILYNDAVEEALCFGWIDSIVKKLDGLHAVQRFTPRNPKRGFAGCPERACCTLQSGSR